MELYRGNKLRVRSEHLDKVMAQLIRTWVYTHDHSAILSPKVEPMIKRLVSMVRRLLDEFCTTCTPDDLLVVVFYYADKFINQVGFMDKNHLTGVLISSVIVTVKFHEDKGLYNSWVAAACKLSRRDIHHMERTFLTTLNYQLVFTCSQINKFFSTHNQAWEERTSLSSPSTSSKPKSSSSRPPSSTISSSHSSPTTRHKSSGSSKRAQPTKIPTSLPLSKVTPSSSSSSPPPLPSTHSKSTTRPSSRQSTTITSTTKPTTTKLSKITKAYKVLNKFKICVAI